MKWDNPELKELTEFETEPFFDRLHGEAYEEWFKDFFEKLSAVVNAHHQSEIEVIREPATIELEPCEGRREGKA